MNNRKKQQGLSFWGWLMTLFALGCFFAVGIQVGPFYMENGSIRNVVTGFTNEVLASNNKTKIKKAFYKGLNMNSVSGLPSNSLKITTKGRGVTIDLVYERRVNIVANASVVVEFNDHFELQNGKMVLKNELAINALKK